MLILASSIRGKVFNKAIYRQFNLLNLFIYLFTYFEIFPFFKNWKISGFTKTKSNYNYKTTKMICYHYMCTRESKDL